MGRLVSLNTKILQLSGLEDTTRLTEAENDFVKNLLALTHNGKVVSTLTERQVDYAESLWGQHFA